MWDREAIQIGSDPGGACGKFHRMDVLTEQLSFTPKDYYHEDL